MGAVARKVSGFHTGARVCAHMCWRGGCKGTICCKDTRYIGAGYGAIQRQLGVGLVQYRCSNWARIGAVQAQQLGAGSVQYSCSSWVLGQNSFQRELAATRAHVPHPCCPGSPRPQAARGPGDPTLRWAGCPRRGGSARDRQAAPSCLGNGGHAGSRQGRSKAGGQRAGG